MNYSFQGQSKRSKHWFDLDIEWVKKIHYMRTSLLQEAVSLQYWRSSSKKYPTVTVPIENVKETGDMKYHPKTIQLECHQNASNLFFFSGKASEFIESRENNSARHITILIE